MGGIMGTLKTWGDRASFEADRFMRANRVRSDITRLKKDIEAAYAQVGHSVVEMHQTGRLPAAAVIDEAVARIRQLERDLQTKEAEALNIQNEKWVEDAPHPHPQVIEGQQPAPFANTYGGPPAPAPQPYTLPTGSYAQQQPPQSYEQPVQSYQQPMQNYQQPPQSYQQPAAMPPNPAPQGGRGEGVPPAPPPVAVSASPDAMTQAMPTRHCSKCGAELRPTARFCPLCGTPAPLGNG
jgi:zinc-ribbon domain